MDVARDDAIHQLGRVLSHNHVLVEGGDIDERGGVANGIVLVLVMHFVDTDRVVSGPLAVVETLTKRERPRMKCSSDRQGHSPFWSDPSIV